MYGVLTSRYLLTSIKDDDGGDRAGGSGGGGCDNVSVKFILWLWPDHTGPESPLS